jgi:translation initiation factor 2 gamma subunit (eIF-2gamma)
VNIGSAAAGGKSVLSRVISVLTKIALTKHVCTAENENIVLSRRVDTTSIGD